MQNGLQERTFETTYKANTGNGIYKFVKRAFDFIVALVAIVAISPLLLIISAIVYLGDPGPVIYGQLRIGKNGKAFKMWKFRSMYKNADKMIDQLTDEQRQQYITEFKMLNQLLRSRKTTKFCHPIVQFGTQRDITFPCFCMDNHRISICAEEIFSSNVLCELFFRHSWQVHIFIH